MEDSLYDNYDKGLNLIPPDNAASSVQGSLNNNQSASFNVANGMNMDMLNSGPLGSTIEIASGGIRFGKTLFDNTVTGFILGIDKKDGNGKFYIGNTTNYLNWDGTTLTIAGSLTLTSGSVAGFTLTATTISATNLVLTSGAVNVANITVGTGATAGGINAANISSDIVFWSGSTYANRATAPFRVDAAGNVTQNNVIATNTGKRDYGDGSDGAVTLGAGTTTLTRDMFYSSLTVPNGATLAAGGYRIFCQGTLTVNSGGDINRNGNNGSDGTSGSGTTHGTKGAVGAALSAGSTLGTVAPGVSGNGGDGGVSGGGTNGVDASNGVDVNKSIGVAGVNGVAGGNGGSGGAGGGTGGLAGNGGALTGTVFNRPNSATQVYMLFDVTPALTQFGSSASNGGSGGGGGGGSSGGGGAQGGGGGGGGGSASPGGILSIFAKDIINNGTIRANGGTGGKGGNGANGVQGGGRGAGGGGGGGGNGGNGGIVILVYNTYTGTAATASGGAGGNGGAKGLGAPTSIDDGIAGTIGTNGTAGSVITITNL